MVEPRTNTERLARDLTIDFLLAFIECSLHETAHGVPSAVTLRMRTMIRDVAPSVLESNTSGFSIAQALRSDLSALLRLLGAFGERKMSIFHHVATQKLLHENDGFREAVSGIVCMNRKGRTSRNRQIELTGAHQVDILESVTENVDCIFFYLREDTSLITAQLGD